MSGDELRRTLERLARNLAFSWLPPIRDVFRDLDPVDWDEADHNPIVLLAGLSDDRFERAAEDEAFGRRVREAERALEAELELPTWWDEQALGSEFLVAYFSMEFALDESLPVYSGGLGVLAGDHLKSASELGVPLVGVGRFYERGYFRQALAETGWQRERYPLNDPTRLPLTLEREPDGRPLLVHLELAGEPVAVRVWRADVGRTRLYLLDTDLEENSPAARGVTDRLYGGDREHRIRQEVVLGVGGVRALRRLGLAPTGVPLNQGRSPGRGGFGSGAAGPAGRSRADTSRTASTRARGSRRSSSRTWTATGPASATSPTRSSGGSTRSASASFYVSRASAGAGRRSA